MGIRMEVFMDISEKWDNEYFNRASVGFEFEEIGNRSVLVLFAEGIRINDNVFEKQAVKMIRVYTVSRDLYYKLDEYFCNNIVTRHTVKDVENFFDELDNFIILHDEGLSTIYFS